MAFFQGLLLILILANAAFADVKEEIAKCASIADKDRRLECFDAVADTLGNDKALIRPATAYGKWFVSTKQSMIDDSTNVYLSLEAISTRAMEPPGRYSICGVLKIKRAYLSSGTFISGKTRSKSSPGLTSKRRSPVIGVYPPIIKPYLRRAGIQSTLRYWRGTRR